MKLLVIGGGGQLGSKIIEKVKDSFDIYATYMTRFPPIDPPRSFKLDKTNRESVFELIRKLKPNIVIDTAALHSVGYCETHKEEAWAVNVEGTKNVAEACEENGVKMVFISTDYVFDGKKGNYTENDLPNPVNYYGITKLEAERKIAQITENHIIARPSVIYSWTPPHQLQIQSSSGKPMNFVMWLIKKLEKKEPVKIVIDQYSSPTLADSLAEILIKACEEEIVGTYHIAGKTRLNRYEFSLKIAENMKLDKALIFPITSDELKQIAERPKDSSLNVYKIEKTLNIKIPQIDEALNIFMVQAKESEVK